MKFIIFLFYYTILFYICALIIIDMKVYVRMSIVGQFQEGSFNSPIAE